MLSITPVRVLIVTGHSAAGAGIAARMAGQPACTVIDTIAPDVDLPTAVAAAHPDVILWDVGDDPDASLELLAEAQDMHVPIVATVSDDRDGIRALAAGARGLLPRDADSEHLVAAVQAAATGLLALDPSVAGAVLPGRPGEAATLVEDLTRREREVLQLMAEGLANKTIAEHLGITEHTAKFHVHTILGKLGTQSRTEAVVQAARLGLITI